MQKDCHEFKTSLGHKNKTLDLKDGAGEMAERLRMETALVQDWNLVPSTTSHSSQHLHLHCQGIQCPLLPILGTHIHIHIHSHRHTLFLELEINLLRSSCQQWLDEAELPCPAAIEQQVQFTADAEPSWDKHVEKPGQLPDSHTKTVSLAV